MRSFLPKALGLLALLTPASARAAGLDVEAWLRRPGVKLLVVEFYASWCKPCMEAVPKWRALHEKYRKDGLRLVVVATQDAQSGCANPGWSPDEVICDDDGFLSERFGAQNLPAAFLWSWQGNLLSSKSHVEEVEQKLTRWIRRSPRVDVQVDTLAAGAKIRAATLRDMVRARLRDDDKLVVVATESERKALRRIQARSLKENFRSAYQCELGQEVSANSLLKVTITGRSRKRLQLSLLSAERGCLVASSVVDWLPQKAAVSVAEAVSSLLQRVRGKTQYPWSKSVPQKKSRLASYDALGKELKALKRKEQQETKRREAKSAEIKRAWEMVRAFATEEAIAKPRRVKALNRFLADYPNDNPYRAPAKTLLGSLTKKPPKLGFSIYDSDNDGIINSKDLCPDSAEDPDGYKDEDGCPDPDNDQDKIPDPEDKCPLAPETVNGFEDSDGCPDRPPLKKKAVTVTGKRLELTSRVFFTPGSARIKKRSFPILIEVASILRRFPKMKIRVEGHTDSSGRQNTNMRVSEQRAKAVKKYLLGQGIAAGRVDAAGYGPNRPLDTNQTPKGRANNRRIEFVITAR